MDSKGPCNCRKCGVTFEGAVLRIGDSCITQSFCPPCFDAESAERLRLRKEKLLEERKQQWRDICPEDYQDSDPARIVRELEGDGVSCSLWRGKECEPLAPAKAAELILGWSNPVLGLGLVGKTGRGKTRLLFLLLEKLHMNGRRVAYVNAASMSDRIAAYASENAAAGDRYVRRMETADVLLIDDLGKDKLTETAEKALYRITEARRGNRKQTFFTANCTGAELEKRMSPDRGAPIVKRLKDMVCSMSFKERKGLAPTTQNA